MAPSSGAEDSRLARLPLTTRRPSQPSALASCIPCSRVPRGRGRCPRRLVAPCRGEFILLRSIAIPPSRSPNKPRRNPGSALDWMPNGPVRQQAGSYGYALIRGNVPESTLPPLPRPLPRGARELFVWVRGYRVEANSFACGASPYLPPVARISLGAIRKLIWIECQTALFASKLAPTVMR